MKLTVFVKSPMIRDGGTIIIFPKARSSADQCPDKQDVEVSETLSFVEFDHCADESWSVKFEPGEINAPASTRFKMLTAGSGDYKDSDGKLQHLDEYQVFHVSGRLVTENDSYDKGIHFYEYLAKSLRCIDFGPHAKVCVAPMNEM